MPTNISKEAIEAVAIYSTLWWLWGVVHYLDQVRKWEKFKLWLLVINLIISAWIGWIIWPILPEALSEPVRFWITSMSWFLSYIILKFIENKWLQLILSKLWIKI